MREEETISKQEENNFYEEQENAAEQVFARELLEEEILSERILRKQETRKYIKIGLTVFITFVCCILFFFVIYRFQGFADVWGKLMIAAQPIFFGLVLAYLLNPIMLFFEKRIYGRAIAKLEEKKARSLSRGLSVAISILFLIGILAFLVAAIVPSTVTSIKTLADSLPSNLDDFSNWTDELLADNPKLAETVDSGIDQIAKWSSNYIENTLKPQAQTYIAEITTGMISIAKSLVNFLIGIFVAVYVMCIQETLTGQSKKILYTLCKPKTANTIIEVVRKSSDIFGGFITGKILDSAIIGVICYIGCLILKMPNAVLVAVIIGVTNIIPFFGPFIGAIPSLLLVVIQSPIHALYLLIFIIVLQQVDGNIIGPKILGNSTGLSSFWVMFAILVFGGMFGFMGMLLGVPIFAVIYYIIQRLVAWGLRKRGLPTDTKQYVHMSHVDVMDGSLKYEEVEKEKDREKKPKEEAFVAPPGDKLYKELQKMEKKRAEKKNKKPLKKS